MKTVALAALLSLGLATPALAQDTSGEVTPGNGSEMAERLDVPTAENATQRGCLAWLDQLGVTIENAAEGELDDAEERRREASRACDDGDYYEGITLAAETIEMITGGEVVESEDGQRMSTELDVPTAENATHRECLAWLGQLGVSINAAQETGNAPDQAEDKRREVARACDDGDYYEGITMAAEIIEMIDGEAEMDQAEN